MGKTETVLHFAKKYYKNIVYVNFVTDVITRDGYEPSNILKNITLVNPSKKYLILVLVEVKATNGTAKSLRTLLESERLKYGVKFVNVNIGFSNNIFTFPYFCLFLLKRFLGDFELE